MPRDPQDRQEQEGCLARGVYLGHLVEMGFRDHRDPPVLMVYLELKVHLEHLVQ